MKKNTLKRNIININYWKIFYIFSVIIISTSGYFYGVYNSIDRDVVNGQVNTPIIWDSTDKIISNIKSTIDDRFVNSRPSSTIPNSQDLQYGIISGFVASYGDPYTQYFSPAIAKQFNETLMGSFGGVGIELVYKDSNTVVVSALKDTPAFRAGIKSGDIIMSVDDVNVTGLNSDIVIQKIRGEVGTKVKIKFFRPEIKNTVEFTITREIIKAPTIDSKIMGDYFIISLYSFTIESPELFKQEMIKFLKSGKNNLILDLRGNPGGAVDSAVLIASYFIDYGNVILQERGRSANNNRVYKAENLKAINSKNKIYVLIDGGSASASEIVAGALQDYNIAKIYGQKSFGKGSVQEVVPLEDGSTLKMTVANWYTPNNHNITEKGIIPDFVIKRNASSTAESELKDTINTIIKNEKIVKGAKK